MIWQLFEKIIPQNPPKSSHSSFFKFLKIGGFWETSQNELGENFSGFWKIIFLQTTIKLLLVILPLPYPTLQTPKHILTKSLIYQKFLVSGDKCALLWKPLSQQHAAICLNLLLGLYLFRRFCSWPFILNLFLASVILFYSLYHRLFIFF